VIAIEPKTVLYIALAVVALIVVVRIVRFLQRLATGIRNGVREAFRPASRIMREEYYTTTQTASIRQYAPPPGRRNAPQRPAIPARRADRRGYHQDGYYQQPMQLPAPRVTVEPQQDYDDPVWEYEPRDTRARQRR